MKRNLWQVLGDTLAALLPKLVSFKNLIAVFASFLGVYVAFRLHAEFLAWAKYEVLVLILFYTSNQFQKWIFARYPLLGGDAAAERETRREIRNG